MLTRVICMGEEISLPPFVVPMVPYSSPGKQLHKNKTQIPAASLQDSFPFIISPSVYHLPCQSQAAEKYP